MHQARSSVSGRPICVAGREYVIDREVSAALPGGDFVDQANILRESGLPDDHVAQVGAQALTSCASKNSQLITHFGRNVPNLNGSHGESLDLLHAHCMHVNAGAAAEGLLRTAAR